MKTGYSTDFCLGIWRKLEESIEKLVYYRAETKCYKSPGGYNLETVELKLPIFIEKDDLVGLEFPFNHSFPISTINNIMGSDLEMFKLIEQN